MTDSTDALTTRADGAPATPDPVCAAAVEMARAAAEESAEGSLGGYLGVTAEADLVVTHTFASTLAGYQGWHWAVTVMRAEGFDDPAVAEVVLLPGGGALLAPPWVPWSERIAKGDLSPGDIVPTTPDDRRLVPAYLDDSDVSPLGDEIALEQVSDVAFELGLGRVRVLSSDGRLDAADRWQNGDSGPSAAMARQAPGACGTCGFLVPLSGSLKAAFGVCANDIVDTDGRVVSVEYGCGAHSEAGADAVTAEHALSELGEVYDDDALDVVTLDGAEPQVEAGPDVLSDLGVDLDTELEPADVPEAAAGPEAGDDPEPGDDPEAVAQPEADDPA